MLLPFLIAKVNDDIRYEFSKKSATSQNQIMAVYASLIVLMIAFIAHKLRGE